MLGCVTRRTLLLVAVLASAPASAARAAAATAVVAAPAAGQARAKATATPARPPRPVSLKRVQFWYRRARRFIRAEATGPDFFLVRTVLPAVPGVAGRPKIRLGRPAVVERASGTIWGAAIVKIGKAQARAGTPLDVELLPWARTVLRMPGAGWRVRPDSVRRTGLVIHPLQAKRRVEYLVIDSNRPLGSEAHRVLLENRSGQTIALDVTLKSTTARRDPGEHRVRAYAPYRP